MSTVVRSNSPVWTENEAWFRALAVDIVQPDLSSARSKPAGKNTHDLFKLDMIGYCKPSQLGLIKVKSWSIILWLQLFIICVAHYNNPRLAERATGSCYIHTLLMTHSTTHSIINLTLHYCLCDSWLVGQQEDIQADDKLHQNLSNPKGHYTQSPTVHWGRSPDDQMCTKHLYVFPVLTSDHHCLQLWGIVQCKVQESWNWWMLVGDAHVHKLYTIAVSRNKVQYELQWCTGIEWLNGLYHKQKSKHCHS